MSGIPFDTPAARFLRGSKVFQRAMLGFAFVVDHWLTYAGRFSKNYRQNEAEFPAARTANKRRAFRGLPAADGVSFDALRPNDNWVNIEDQYEISFIREKSAAFARRLPKKRRRTLACITRGARGRRRRNRFGKKLPRHFSETERRSLRHRGMVRPSNRRNSGNGPRVNRKRSRSRARVFTWVIFPSTRPRATCSSCSMA